MPDLEAAGDVATGGLLGRAVEPGAGEAADGHTHEINCLNCGCELVGAYCHCCGQRGHVHRTISAWWHDFLHSVLHLDGKFWRTLPMLAWRPGELTRRYVHGERAKFISPLALFLFTVFLMFAVFSIAGPALGDLGMNQSVEEGLNEERARLQRLQSQRAGSSEPAAAAELDQRIAEAREDIATLEDLRESGITTATFGEESAIVESGGMFDTAYRKAKANPQLLLYKLQANAYKFSWALIPISVPFVWVLFLHRRRYRREFTAYDHLVFVTYSIAFMSLAFVTLVAIKSAGIDNRGVDAAMLLVPAVHIYRQLRGAYLLSRPSALWRTILLLIFANIALGLFVALLLVLGVLG